MINKLALALILVSESQMSNGLYLEADVAERYSFAYINQQARAEVATGMYNIGPGED